MILRDAFALHRKWWDWEQDPEPSLVGVWTDWDYVLLDVYQLIEDFTDSESGQFMPYDQSGDVHWETKRQTSGYLEAVEKETKKKATGPGERIYAVPVFDESKPLPTIDSWLADLEEDKPRVPSEARDARPPTPEELAAMRGD